MIIYSPNSKFTMQRLADHVANGAYFHAAFRYKSKYKTEQLFENDELVSEYLVQTESISDVLKKLTDRYDLNLSARQRTYRLETGKPICTLILQQDLYIHDEFDIYLLFTTQQSRDFNAQCGVTTSKLVNAKERLKIEQLQENFLNFSWTKPVVEQEKELIYEYFKDREQLKFVLNEPISLDVTQNVVLELVRTDHKKYLRSVDKDYKDRIRSFSWSWRYTKQSQLMMKKKLIDIVNKLISQKKNTLAERNRGELKAYFSMIETWSVFKESRQQAGEMLHFARRFLRHKAKKTWQQIDVEPPHLTYLPRLETYAEATAEYLKRRYAFHQLDREITREEASKDSEEFYDYISELKYENQ